MKLHKVVKNRMGEKAHPVAEEADSNPVSGPKAGRMNWILSSTMESVGTVEAAAEKLAMEAGL